MFFWEAASPRNVISYRRPPVGRTAAAAGHRIVGAGALGNFVGLGLALAGFTGLTFIDPDVIEVTNLNRQVFFAEAVGAGKAETLAARLNHCLPPRPWRWQDYFREETDISGFDVIFDCVDNFASRIILSEACAAGRQDSHQRRLRCRRRAGGGVSSRAAAADAGSPAGIVGYRGPAPAGSAGNGPPASTNLIRR